MAKNISTSVEEELQILAYCRELGKNYPHLVGKMRDALERGLQEAFNNQREDAMKWEIIANTALSLVKDSRVAKSHKTWATDLLDIKIKELATRGSLNWDTYLNKKKDSHE